MEKIKAIFCDFDWTLFDHKTRSFNQKGVEGLNLAHEKGVKLIIDSARTYHSLKGLNTFNLIPFDGFVVSNGGACMIDGKTLYADFIPDEVAKEMTAWLDEHGFGYNLICQYETFIKVRDRKLVKDFYKVFYEPYPSDISRYDGQRVLTIQVFCYPEHDRELRALCDKYHLLFNRFADTNTEICGREFLKSKGVKTIYDYLGLNRDEAMAFGDDLNDISMFDMVKYGVCMGNGKDEAKKHAFYVTDPIDEDGLYKALKHFGVID